MEHLKHVLALISETIGLTIDVDETDLTDADRKRINEDLSTIPEEMLEDFVLGDYEDCDTFAEMMRVNWPHIPVTPELIRVDKFLADIFGTREKEGYYS